MKAIKKTFKHLMLTSKFFYISQYIFQSIKWEISGNNAPSNIFLSNDAETNLDL